MSILLTMLYFDIINIHIIIFKKLLKEIISFKYDIEILFLFIYLQTTETIIICLFYAT